MKRFYFPIFIWFLLLLGLGFVGLSQSYLAAYENSASSNLQANLLSVILKEAQTRKNQEIAKYEGASLLFVGDIMLSRGVKSQMERHKNPNYPFLRIADFLRSHDVVFGNLEGPISDKGVNQGSEYSFRADPEAVKGLMHAGFNVLNLANNHIWDWGSKALTRTMEVLENNGLSWVGAGRDEAEANTPLVVKIGSSDKGLKIAFLGYTNLYPKSLEAERDKPGISSFDVPRIEEIIKELKEEKMADIVVVSLHWGKEYETQPSDSQREVAHSLINAGADLIVGHHPHVVQETEAYNGKWTVYSLGNFVFDQNFSQETNRGLALQVQIEHKNIKSIEPLEIKINDTFQPELIK